MGKILKSVKNDYSIFNLKRYLKGGKFKFTIEVIDQVENVMIENEYSAESVFERFDEMTLDYDFSEPV